MARSLTPVLLAAPALALGTSAMAQEVRCSTLVDLDASLTRSPGWEDGIARKIADAGEDPARVCVTRLEILRSSKPVTVSQATDGRLEPTCVADPSVPGGSVCTWAFTPAEHRVIAGDVLHIQIHGSDFNAGR